MNRTETIPMNAVRVAGKVRKGKFIVKAPLRLADGDVEVTGVDALIAADALRLGLTLAIHNLNDFPGIPELKVIKPY